MSKNKETRIVVMGDNHGNHSDPETLKAENERLRKAGDAMADCINEFRRGILCNALDKVGGFRVWLNWKKAQSDLPQVEGETK